jgi:hypothetical protein
VKAPDFYVIQRGAWFYSCAEGWVGLDYATVYTAEERAREELPYPYSALTAPDIAWKKLPKLPT